MKPRVNALVLTGYGLNCDHETAYALELAGAHPRRSHINALIDGSVTLDDFRIMVFGGGFSWADDHGAGVIQAIRMHTHIGDQIREFIHKDNLILGICNGFQTIVNMGLLPDLDPSSSAEASPRRTVALIHNDCGNFRDDWVFLKTDPQSPCIFTRGLDLLEFPVRHGEGKLYTDPATLEQLAKNGQIALQYALPDGTPANGQFPYNPNGSLNDIAGICDSTGRVFGLMPHPEAYHHWTNHPGWPLAQEKHKRRGQPFGNGLTPGVTLLKNAVDYCARS